MQLLYSKKVNYKTGKSVSINQDTFVELSYYSINMKKLISYQLSNMSHGS